MSATEWLKSGLRAWLWKHNRPHKPLTFWIKRILLFISMLALQPNWSYWGLLDRELDFIVLHKRTLFISPQKNTRVQVQTCDFTGKMEMPAICRKRGLCKTGCPPNRGGVHGKCKRSVLIPRKLAHLLKDDFPDKKNSFFWAFPILGAPPAQTDSDTFVKKERKSCANWHTRGGGCSNWFWHVLI